MVWKTIQEAKPLIKKVRILEESLRIDGEKKNRI